MRILVQIVRLPFRIVGRVIELIRSNDITDVYGDNPNRITDEQRQTSHAVISNAVNVGRGGC